MMRITEAWFEFKGIRCTAKNVRLMQMPSRPIPAPKGRFVDVPGRDGLLWIDDGARDATQIKVSCETMDGYSRDAIAGQGIRCDGRRGGCVGAEASAL